MSIDFYTLCGIFCNARISGPSLFRFGLDFLVSRTRKEEDVRSGLRGWVENDVGNGKEFSFKLTLWEETLETAVKLLYAKNIVFRLQNEPTDNDWIYAVSTVVQQSCSGDDCLSTGKTRTFGIF